MSKRGRILVVVIAIVIQMILAVLYGFSMIAVPAWGGFAGWCACAAIVCRMIGAPEMI